MTLLPSLMFSAPSFSFLMISCFLMVGGLLCSFYNSILNENDIVNINIYNINI